MSLALIAAAAASAQTTPIQSVSSRDAGKPIDGFFAINGSKMFHIVGEDEAKVRQRLGWMADLGIKTDRVDLWWHVVEPEKGRWDFSRADKSFEIFEEHGVQWYPILCYGAAYWPQGTNSPQADENIDEFVEYVRQTVSRYRGRAPAWSLWNEPNILPFWAPTPDVEMYARLLKAVYPVFKEADPDALLAAPAVAPIGPWDKGFTERVLQLGTANSFDVFDYHYYRPVAPEPEVPGEIAEIRATLHRYGADKPIYISEAGVVSWFSGKMDLDRQAQLVVRNHLLTLGLGVEKFFYFDLQNWRDNEAETWDTQLGLVDANGQLKPSFHAYKAMRQVLNGSQVIGRVDLPGGRNEGVLFYRPDEGFTLAAWAVDEGGVGILPIQADADASAVDGMGEPITLARNESKDSVLVPLGQLPVYVRGVSIDYLKDAGIRFERELTYVAAGDTTDMRAAIDPLLGNGETTIRWRELPAGFTWNSENSELTVDRDVPPGRYTLRGFIGVAPSRDRLEALSDRGIGRTTSTVVEVVPSMSMRLRPHMDEGRPRGYATVFNQTQRDLGQALRLIEKVGRNERTVAEVLRWDVQPVQTREFLFDLAEPVMARTINNAEWILQYGSERSKPFRVVAVPILKEAPTVDGEGDEWQGLPAMQVDLPEQVTRQVGLWTAENISGKVHVAVGQGNLYVFADVVDNASCGRNQTPHLMWMGDAIELYVGSAGPTRRGMIDKTVERQIGLAPQTANGKAEVFWFHEDVAVPEATIVAKQHAGGYRIEASIPLTALKLDPAAFAEGKLIGLDVKINDSDAGEFAPAGVRAGRDLVWNGDGTNWINPSVWGLGVMRAR